MMGFSIRKDYTTPMSTLEYILSALSLILAVALALSRKQIAALTRQLKEEHKKRVFPLLELRLDENTHAFYLSNISDTPAYSIVFEQVPVTLESGVERTFGFQFDLVKELKPQAEVLLNYELYYHNQKEPDHFKKSLFTHVSFSKIRFHLTYQNIHHAFFKMTVQKTRTHFQLIDAGPLEKTK